MGYRTQFWGDQGQSLTHQNLLPQVQGIQALATSLSSKLGHLEQEIKDVLKCCIDDLESNLLLSSRLFLTI